MKEIIRIDNLEFLLYQCVGKLVDQQATTKTEIYGGGSYINAYGHVTVAPVQSSSYTTKSFFLQDQFGKDHPFAFDDDSIPAMRLGHTIQIIWLIPSSKPTGKFVIVRNVTTNRTSSFYNQVESAGLLYTPGELSLLQATDLLILPFNLCAMFMLGEWIRISGIGFKCLYCWFIPLGCLIYYGWRTIKVQLRNMLDTNIYDSTTFIQYLVSGNVKTEIKDGIMLIIFSLIIMIWLIIYVWKKNKCYKERVKVLKQEVRKRLI